MNLARVAAAAVIAWIVSIGIGFLVNGLILADLARANAAAMRPEADLMANLPIGFAFLLLGFFAFAYAYARGYEGGNGIMEGGTASVEYLAQPTSVASAVRTAIDSAIARQAAARMLREAG